MIAARITVALAAAVTVSFGLEQGRAQDRLESRR
jgi:hypothetical protein